MDHSERATKTLFMNQFPATRTMYYNKEVMARGYTAFDDLEQSERSTKSGQERQLQEHAEKLQKHANILAQLGNDHDAIKMYEKSLNMFYVVYGAKANNDFIAWDLHALGVLQTSLGRNVEARRRCTKALKMYDRLYGPKGKDNETKLESLLRLLVRLERKLGDHDAASKYQRRLSTLIANRT